MQNKSVGQNTVIDNWKMPLVLVSFLLIALLSIYYSTTLSFVHIWNSSDTFAHGYLILPISLWLIWRNRTHFYHIQPRVNYYAIPLIFLCSFGWLLAYFVDVLVVQQLALAALIPLVVLGVLGWQVVKTAAFPLFFLMFAVPMGEGLVPSLIEFTADFTVAMVQLTGIPIYREGTFFQLPTGNWSVVEACSGVRYLIASVTLGVLYAYLTYQSLPKRLIFIAVSIIVPIIANGLRAFLIVMIGHFSDMELATGVDHLVYGWVFFGIVIAIMFYIGSFWRDEEKEVEAPNVSMNKNQVGASLNAKNGLFMAALILITASALPAKAYLNNAEIDVDSIEISVSAVNAWEKSDQLLSDWVPSYGNMDASYIQQYTQQSASVDLFIGYYFAQRDGAQLVTSSNALTKEKEPWQKLGGSSLDLTMPEGDIKIPVAHLKKGDVELLVAYFYYLDGRIVTNDYIAKLIEAKTQLLGEDRAASIVTISSALNDNHDQVIANIKLFMKEMNESVFQSIDVAGGVK